MQVEQDSGFEKGHSSRIENTRAKTAVSSTAVPSVLESVRDAVNLFQYHSPKQYLLDWLTARQKLELGFSVRRWAIEMEISHSLLVMLLQGKRPLRLKHVSPIAQGLRLASHEKLYLQALIEFENAETPQKKTLVSHWLAELNPGKDFKIREVDDFKVIAHWIHMAILAMTHLKDFKGSPEEIHARLGRRATIHEVRAALGRLESLNLVERGDDGKLRKTVHRVTTRDDVANAGVREYQKQASILAQTAVDEQSVLEREFQSFALSIDRARLPEAKELIRKFRSQFCQLLTTDAGTEVYQINLQLFRLTESPDSVNDDVHRAEDEGADTGVQPNPTAV